MYNVYVFFTTGTRIYVHVFVYIYIYIYIYLFLFLSISSLAVGLIPRCTYMHTHISFFFLSHRNTAVDVRQ